MVLAVLLVGAFRVWAQPSVNDADVLPPPLPAEEIPEPPSGVLSPAPGAAPPGADPAVATALPHPQSTGPLVVLNHPNGVMANYGREGNQRAAKLRSDTPQSYTFDRALLRDVLRFLAEEAGLPYIGIPEHSAKAQRLVTFKMTAPPFTALESLARQNDVKLDYEDGVWFMRIKDANFERVTAAENANELIGVIYQLKHDPVDRVDFREGANGGGAVARNSNQGASGASSAAPNNMPLQYSQRVFQAKAPRIVNEIRSMLGMGPLQYNADGTVVDPEAVGQPFHVGQRAPLPPSDGEVGAFQAGSGGATAAAPAAQAGGRQGQEDANMLPVYVPPQRPQVVYNSDMNILWVVATRKQHKWVADYLSKVDKPQDLIAIEVKFFETRKNPQTDFGINWEGTFGEDGLRVHGSASMNPAGTLTRNRETTDRRSSASGSQTGTDPLGLPPFDFNRSTRSSDTVNTMINNLAIPYSAVLSTSDVSIALQAFAKDRDSSLVQYPRVLTINNREVAITSAENTPVNSGTQNVTSGTIGGQNVGSLEYIPVGTQINILPKSVGSRQIALTVAITVSQIVDYVPLDLGTGQNIYPVTTQRVYNASLQVDSGYTLAVGGLEKSADRNSVGGIPVLKDIPGLGYLFKNKGRSRDKSNLIIFITPYLISDPSRTPGISEHPEAVIPIRPGVPPPAPNFTPDGGLLGGDAAIPGALDWLEFQLQYFTQTNVEGRNDSRSMSELRTVIERARTLVAILQDKVAAGKGYASAELTDFSTRADSLLLELNKVLAQAQLNQFQLRQGFP